MNNIALFLAQLSSGQAAPGQNGSGTAGETGLQNFEFWSSVLASLDGEQTNLSLDTSLEGDVLPDGGEVTADKLLFQKNAAVDLSKRIEIAEIFIDRLTIKQSELSDTVEDQVLFEKLNQQIDLLRQQVEIWKQVEASAGDVPVSALILSGYSPSQITDIQKSIEDLEAKLGRKITLLDLIAGVGNVLPEPEHKYDTETKIKTTAAGQDVLVEVENTDSEQPESCHLFEDERSKHSLPDFACRIVQTAREQKEARESGEDVIPLGEIIQNALKTEKKNGTAPHSNSPIDAVDVTHGETVPQEAQNVEASSPANQDQNLQDDVLAAALNALHTGGDNTEAIDAEYSYTEQNLSVREAGTDRAAKNIQQPGNVGTSTDVKSQNNPAGQSGTQAAAAAAIQDGIAVPQSYASFDEALYFSSGEQSAFNIHSGLPFSNTTQAAHMITHSHQQAGQPHPATEMISARLQQAGQSNQNQVMTLHLDPAELGRVEVQLVFGKDKTVKAHMLVEKPETFFLMQRDSSALERALQDSGLEIDGGGIDFELAEDGSAFEQNNQGQGGGEKYGGTSGGDGDALDAEGLIESTMTWQVDPDSGHTRYSILA